MIWRHKKKIQSLTPCSEEDPNLISHNKQFAPSLITSSQTLTSFAVLNFTSTYQYNIDNMKFTSLVLLAAVGVVSAGKPQLSVRLLISWITSCIRSEQLLAFEHRHLHVFDSNHSIFISMCNRFRFVMDNSTDWMD
jgi:hypothetical protein